MNLKKLFKKLLYALAMLVLLLLLYRQVRIENMPAAQTRIPFRVEQEEIPTPKRPGTQSIRIVGPPIKVVKFQLDFRRRPKPLDWNFLERIDRRADVSIEGFIDVDGNFLILRVNDRGHPRAGTYIRDVLETWKFLQYKTGIIKYYFNVPTSMENMKVQIDLRGLQKNARFVGPYEEVQDGLIYYLDGLNQKNVMLIN
ncbi:hypothetical protein GWO43_25265 [candidate division KSB1 bacterium]|nr:hypothetical protein [candidate division KSB1 bacterium]NIR68868.1 hypothetical protein [candidate division KSB1 bacterium]NIS27236.1 hypothetical protein [candidate division KSB1 bacterium]NIT74121.1 hypothetical protein [candidate division KSB1 bacterium]NIU27970.1 hypothetical protein [candidate division KSB1 bacterium]